MDAVLSHPLFMPILVTLVVIGVFPLLAGYITLVERKVLADFQVRLGPMRVGAHGLLQRRPRPGVTSSPLMTDGPPIEE